MKKIIAVCLFCLSCGASTKTVTDIGTEIAKTIECVDVDLMKGMTPEATAIDCGLKDAADVARIVGGAERLAAHRTNRGSDAGTDAK